MIWKGIEHSNAHCGPGTFGFTGEGYDFHRCISWLITQEGLEFAAKTVTLYRHYGNMPMRSDGVTPQEFKPKCIHVNHLSGDVVNAVGLSNPGVEAILAMRRWQARTEPFSISFAMVEPLMTCRLQELNNFLDIMEMHLPAFKARKAVALQINFGCPNKGGGKQLETSWEIQEVISRAQRLKVAIAANFSPVAPYELILAAANHDGCDALWLANTIPFGHPDIRWRTRYRGGVSPLIRRGFKVPGGYSGRAAIPLGCNTIRQLRRDRIDKPIVAGNGIRFPWDVRAFAEAGANGAALGTVICTMPYLFRLNLRAIRHYFPQ